MSARRAASRPIGARLACLRPVAHALRDPYFKVVWRPIDSSWSHAGLTAAVGGFNPTGHCFYAAGRSAFADWHADPDNYCCAPEAEIELATDVLRFAHDYFHAWFYRLIADLLPEFHVRTPGNINELETQAFFLVLSEAVAVVATDYWYLSLGGLRLRCGTLFDLGPMTVHYRERNLHLYRRSQPQLTVQTPGFFARIARLYGAGEFEGFAERDLLENRALADWMIRELLISPRQRIVARSWLAHLGGIAIDDPVRSGKFTALIRSHANLINALGERVWNKVRQGRMDFVAIRSDQGQWTVTRDGPLDARFANISHMSDRGIDWKNGGLDCWAAYVDQVLSRRVLPTDKGEKAHILGELEIIRKTVDSNRLQCLLSNLEVVPGEDPAPLEMLFVN